MISAGEVGALFVIKDEASAVLKKISDSLYALQDTIARTTLAFRGLGDASGLTASLGALDEKLLAVTESARASGTAASSATRGFADIGVSADASAAAVARLGKEMAAVSRESKALNGGFVVPGAGGSRGGGHGGRGGMFHAHETAGPIGVRTHETGGMAAIGLGAVVWESLQAAAKLQAAQNQLALGGVSQSEVNKATRLSYDIGQRYGLPATEVLTTIGEIRNPLNKGDTPDAGVEDAMRHVDKLSQAQVMLRTRGGKTGAGAADELYDIVKSAEFRGAVSDDKFDAVVDAAVRADLATGWKVSPREFLQSYKMMKGALPGLSDEFLFNISPELDQEFGGSSAGTALASLYQQLVSGQMRTSGVRLLDSLGMIDESKVDFDKNGRIVKMRPGAYKDEETFKSDPLKAMGDLQAAMIAHGITSESAQRDEIAQIFGNRNAAQMAQTLMFQLQRLMRTSQGIGATMATGPGAEVLLGGNAQTDWDRFTSAAQNAGAALGTQLLPDAVGALNNLTTTVNAVASLFRDGFSAQALHDAFFGAATPDKDKSWTDKTQDWIRDHSPIARAVNGTEGLPTGTPTPWGPAGKITRADLPYLNQPNLQGIGTPPPANVSASLSGQATVQTGPITVSVSGQSIAAALSGEIKAIITGLFASALRSQNGPAAFDGHSAPAYPDLHGGH